MIILIPSPRGPIVPAGRLESARGGIATSARISVRRFTKRKAQIQISEITEVGTLTGQPHVLGGPAAVRVGVRVGPELGRGRGGRRLGIGFAPPASTGRVGAGRIGRRGIEVRRGSIHPIERDLTLTPPARVGLDRGCRVAGTVRRHGSGCGRGRAGRAEVVFALAAQFGECKDGAVRPLSEDLEVSYMSVSSDTQSVADTPW